MCMVNNNATSNISVNSTNVKPSSEAQCGELVAKDGGYSVRKLPYYHYSILANMKVYDSNTCKK